MNSTAGTFVTICGLCRGEIARLGHGGLLLRKGPDGELIGATVLHRACAATVRSDPSEHLQVIRGSDVAVDADLRQHLRDLARAVEDGNAAQAIRVFAKLGLRESRRRRGKSRRPGFWEG